MYPQRDPDQFEVEIVLAHYLVSGTLEPLGELMTYLNDHTRLHVAIKNGQIRPLNDYVLTDINPQLLHINRLQIEFLSFLNPETLVHVQILKTRRPLLIYTDNYMIKGYIHVNADKPMRELFDGLVDFFPISDVRLQLLHPLHRTPTLQVPLMVLNRTSIIAYHKLPPPPKPSGGNTEKLG